MTIDELGVELALGTVHERHAVRPVRDGSGAGEGLARESRERRLEIHVRLAVAGGARSGRSANVLWVGKTWSPGSAVDTSSAMIRGSGSPVSSAYSSALS